MLVCVYVFSLVFKLRLFDIVFCTTNILCYKKEFTERTKHQVSKRECSVALEEVHPGRAHNLCKYLQPGCPETAPGCC